MTTLDLFPDELLTTTRSVRRRLDLTPPVEPEVLRECVEIAEQSGLWGWVYPGQVALIPLAYTLGTTFRPGPRPPLDGVLRWDRW